MGLEQNDLFIFVGHGKRVIYKDERYTEARYNGEYCSNVRKKFSAFRDSGIKQFPD